MNRISAFTRGTQRETSSPAPHGGKTWTHITNGIGAQDFVHVVREDTKRAGLLYAGAEHGVYVSFDDGARWQPFSLNLPDVQVADLVVEEQDLVIATHGRSFYVLDGIDSLRQLAPELAGKAAHLFEPGVAYRRARPASIDFLLKAPVRSAAIEILDAKGALVRRYANDNLKRAGWNRVRWDLRSAGAVTFPGMILRSASPERGPWAPPGTYTVRLVVDGQTQEQTLVVRKDPRLTDVSEADLQAQFDLASQVRDRTNAANDAVVRIRALKKQIGERAGVLKDVETKHAAEALLKSLSTIEVGDLPGQEPESQGSAQLPDPSQQPHRRVAAGHRRGGRSADAAELLCLQGVVLRA